MVSGGGDWWLCLVPPPPKKTYQTIEHGPFCTVLVISLGDGNGKESPKEK